MKKYGQIRCYERLLSLLPKSFTTLIRFVYTKNDTLFFVFAHPSGKMEFNYKRSLIKSLLSQILVHFPECECLSVKEIQCFITNLPENKPLAFASNASIHYEERALGEFINTCHDPKLHALFESIKQTIVLKNARSAT